MKSWLSRISVLFLLSLCMVIFAACGGNNPSNEQDAQADANEKQKEEMETTEADTSDEASEAEENEEEASSSVENNPTDVEGILLKAAQVMTETTAMTLTGTIESETDMEGIAEKEMTEITGLLSFDPLVQELNMDTTSEANGESESTQNKMYLTEEGIYFFMDEVDSWILLSSEGANVTGEMNAVMSSIQLEYFANYADKFTLSEENGSFVLTYSGAGEELKSLIFGAMKDVLGEALTDNLMDLYSEISGTYEYVFDKDTFHLIATNMDLDMTLDMGIGKVTSSDQIHYEYGDYNEVDSVVVPDEVTDNAKTMEEMMGDFGVDMDELDMED